MTGCARPILLIADPADNRTACFQAALAAHGQPPAEVLAYPDVIAEPALLAKRAPHGALVRIESPGRNFAIYRALLQRGAVAAHQEGCPALPAAEIARLEPDKGLILYPRQWYLGFRAVLESLADVLAARPDLAVSMHPREIAVTFDKRLCHARLREAGVPVPPALPPVEGYNALRAAMIASHSPRVFLKLRHGSAASGVVALATAGARVQGHTTVEIVHDTQLYNTRRMRRIEREDEVRPLIDALCRHGAHVERWVPKAAVDGQVCDLRLVVIAGRPSHGVLRLSRTPITNLHLGNTRREMAALRARMTDDAWAAMEESGRQVATLFGTPLQIALDIAVSLDYRRHAVLEVNAFGDLLKDVTVDGVDTYGAQVRALGEGVCA